LDIKNRLILSYFAFCFPVFHLLHKVLIRASNTGIPNTGIPP